MEHVSKQMEWICCAEGEDSVLNRLQNISVVSAEELSNLMTIEAAQESKQSNEAPKEPQAPTQTERNRRPSGRQVVLRYPNGDTYTGEVFGKRREGKGVFTSPEETYDGEWLDDKQHGFGTHHWSDGRSYEGEYFRGKFHGKGRMEWDSGVEKMIYEGEYKDDMKHGQGKFTWQNGSSYQGGWVDGMRHGMATFITPDGVEKVGFWDYDTFLHWQDEEPKIASPLKRQQVPGRAKWSSS
eukprot:TRINITY_DN76_c0_g2_i1.p1 TRINITY_DN76_c0_g2~~TRINITY_DN76_c0_g2_i1.p1  ORF type:complete len:239 (+),score=49.80 TRINITY_DN76_c0_g2_i1:52-768(+)